MKKFKDIRTGVIHIVTNDKLVEQYENHSDIYVEVKAEKKPANKKQDENKDAE